MFLPDSRAQTALRALYRGEAPPVPDFELGLSTTVPDLSADGAGYVNITEPTAPSYARVPVAPSEFTVTDRYAEAQVQWPDTVDDLGDILAWVLFDATSGVATDAGRGDDGDAMPLPAGTSNITITVRIDAPESDY